MATPSAAPPAAPSEVPVCIITRTLPGAEATATRLEARGHRPVILPAMDVVALSPQWQLSGVQAVLMTSASAAHTLAPDPALRAVPLYAVGDATARAAREAGFQQIVSARGDGATLAMLVADRLKPADGALLHLRGGEVAGDVAGMLAACGFETRQALVYETRAAPGFGSALREAMAGRAGAILLHSPAGARIVAAGLARSDVGAFSAVGLSQAAVDPVRALAWRRVEASVRPDEDALIDALELALRSGPGDQDDG